MCGIAGLLTFHNHFQIQHRLDDLKRMPQTLLHRGPENLGCWHDSRIFLSQTRLKIIDLSPQANQPMFNEDKQIVLIFNGEIYNFKTLRKDLQNKGHLFQSQGDSEVIVHLYEELGEDFVSHLEGMFAFALWDQKKQKLILARDRTGKKPLFYVKTQDFFAFASEIKAFFPLPDIQIEPNTELFPYYFIYGTIPTPQTFYKNIFSLEAGQMLRINAQGDCAKQKYWHPETFFSINRSDIPKQEAIQHIRFLLKKAVSKRLLSDVPLGAFLSGGIDSSIVTGIAAHEISRPLKTFSIGFEGDRERDETDYAREVSRHFGTDHTEYHVTADHLPPLFEKLIWHYDGPFGDPSCVPTAMVSGLAKQKVTVVLTGDGGDELFGGYHRFWASLRLAQMPPWLRGISQKTVYTLLKMKLLPPQGYGQRLHAAAHLSLENRLTHWTSFFYDDLRDILNPDFLSPLKISKNFHYQPYLADTQNMTPLSKMLYLNLKTYLLDDLNVKMDRASMMVGLETRSPFLDHHLIEYCASLPQHYFIKGFQRKVILRETYRDMLPPAIYKRGKLGFDAPLAKWFRGPLQSFVRDELFPLTPIREFVNPAYVTRLADAHAKGADHSLKLWNLLMFKKWMALMPGWRKERP